MRKRASCRSAGVASPHSSKAEAAAEGEAVDRRDGGFGKRLYAVVQPPAGKLEIHELPFAASLVAGDVGAGGECLVAGAGQDEHPDFGIALDLVERRLEGVEHRAGQGVQLFRPVEREDA